MKFLLIIFPLTLIALVIQAAAQYPAYIPGNREVIVFTDPEVEREKIRAYENRTKVLKEDQEAREAERRAQAYERAKKDRLAKVRRLRGR